MHDSEIYRLWTYRITNVDVYDVNEKLILDALMGLLGIEEIMRVIYKIT